MRFPTSKEQPSLALIKTHDATVPAVVLVGVDVGLAAGGGRCQRSVGGAAGLEAVRAEAGVVGLAGALEVAWLCTQAARTLFR